MKLYELSPAEGSKKDPKRKGRGHATGNGKTAGKGHKGQNARSGGGGRPGFEGGCLYTDVCPNADLPIYLLRSMCQLTLKSLTDLTQTQRLLPSCLKKQV